MLNAASNAIPSNGGSYSSDKLSNTGEAEIATDSIGGFFLSDYKKHDDLKQMLDSNKDGLKLEAMKRIIGMVAKGRDASDLFPAVVKNVVSKNIEVKKLVYVYLVRYAEDQQDLALLSISTFQRALKDPNQLIRASALRVLSSIRVPMIVPIVMLAIKDSANDMSPYVRKTAAHAIPKLYSLDPEQKEELVNVLEKLLSDKTTLVVGSAVMAFEEVCPERIDLIHKNYRKLCNLLVDVDEWGQVIIVTMLTRYVRTQFVDPNCDVDNDEEIKDYYDDDSDTNDPKKTKLSLDPDHRLLLRNAKPLLQSRNASVVMAVVQLYHHTAPSSEVMVAAKALIRLLRSHREVQTIVLHCIANISVTRKGMFEPFLKSFFVRTSDPTHIKLLKLNILTNLATDTSISIILREIQTYISSSDKEFVGASIQAIGRCASNIKEVTDICLNGLVCLLSNRDEAVVAESVVVIKKLLQTQPTEHKTIIAHMAKLMDFITVSQARASILWLLGEYSDRVPKIAPDVLRKMAKTFVNEKDIVKLQTLNLAVKLYLSNPEQTAPYCQYIFQLAKYDQNYDIRDRVRFLRFFVFDFKAKHEEEFAKFSKKVFLTPKPAPTLTSIFQESQFQLGTLSHYLDTPCVGYKALMPFPETAPDPSVREVSEPNTANNFHEKKNKGYKNYFYSDNESNAAEENDSERKTSESSSSNSSDSDSDSSSYSSSDSSSSAKSDSESPKKNKRQSKTSSSESNESSSETDSESNDSEDSIPKKVKEVKMKPAKTVQQPKNNLDLLLELDNVMPITPVMTPSLGGFLSPQPLYSNPEICQISPSFNSLESKELLNKITGYGLKIDYRFTRTPNLISAAMTNIQLIFNNGSSSTITNIRVGNKNLPSGIVMHDFAEITKLEPNETFCSALGINFNDSTQPISFNIDFKVNEEFKSCAVNMKAPVGENLSGVLLTESIFSSEKDKLKGMNEHSAKIGFTKSWKNLGEEVFKIANVSLISNENDIARFAAQTLSSKSLVLVTISKMDEANIEITVNCEKMIVGSILLNELKSNLH